MRRVVFNQKGGVCKSSIVCNLAARAAAAGLKTLVVDLDVQGNSSYYLGYDTYADERAGVPDGTVAELLKQTTTGWFNNIKRPQSFVHQTAFDRLDLMPSSPLLEHIEKELESRYKIYKLRDALLTLSEDYDRVYIDTPPNFNFYSKSALIAGQCVLIPFDCDGFSKQALYNLTGNIMGLRKDHNPDLRVEGVVVNEFNAQANLPRTLVAELRQEQLPVLEQFLPASVKMRESHRMQKPLVYALPGHKLSRAFTALHQSLEAESRETRPLT